MKDEAWSLTMTDVSLILLSDVTSDYANNEANDFYSQSIPQPVFTWIRMESLDCDITQNVLIQSRDGVDFFNSLKPW